MINKLIAGRKWRPSFFLTLDGFVLELQLPLIDRDRMDALKDICWASVAGKLCGSIDLIVFNAFLSHSCLLWLSTETISTRYSSSKLKVGREGSPVCRLTTSHSSITCPKAQNDGD